MEVQVEDGLPSIVARVAGEAVAGRLHSHLAGDPSSRRDQPTECRLVPRLGLSCRQKVLLGVDQEGGRAPASLDGLRDVEGDHEVILVEDLRPKLAADDLAEDALGQVTPPAFPPRRHPSSAAGGIALVTAPRNAS